MRILASKKYETYAFAQKVGSEEEFSFYNLDNELPSELPHIHICVRKDNKDFKYSKSLRYGNPLKSVGKIILRKDCKYTIENLQIESDNQFTNKQKKLFVDWLNQKTFLNAKNGKIALMDYLKSNGFGYFEEEFKNWENFQQGELKC